MYFRYKMAIRAGGISIIVLIFLILCGRNFIVRKYTDRKLAAIEERHQLAIKYKDVYMQGLSGIRIDGLSIVPSNADTLLNAESIEVSLALPKLLLLKVKVQEIGVNHLSVCFIKQEKNSNFDFLYRNMPSDKQHVNAVEAERNYAGNACKVLDRVIHLLPANASLTDLRISYRNKDDNLQIEIPSLFIKDHAFETNIRSTENGISGEWKCKGELQSKQKQLKICLSTPRETKITLPFLKYRWGACVQFDTLSFEMSTLKEEKDLHALQGRTYISGLTIHQERISPDTVSLNQGLLDWKLNIGKNFFELDSTTELQFNELKLNPYLKITRDKDWRITASVDKKDFPANELFNSLPHGLFYNLEGLKAEGTLSWHFLLDMDLSQIDSLQFESTLNGRNFHITNYGNTDLRKMNEPFIYTVYENGEPVRTFEIGTANPSFRPFNAVSHYLPLAIMQSEDAGFFQHAGFIPSAIRESLIQDIKERRFARGGSTLSMQLVKNVFLSRKKTIARKLEEILIVWLIETNHLTPKERMFEVYLNIVEWGPLIYGAAEASHFYFKKEPADLTLSECIFLASIIPKPKHVRYCFDGLELKPYYEEYFNVILNRMTDRGRITAEEAQNAGPGSVKITGPAVNMLKASGIQEEDI